MGAVVVIYTVMGGIKAVTWSDVQQMVHHLRWAGGGAGDRASCCCRTSVSFGDAVYLAGAAGRLNAVTTHFDWNDRYNLWSGLIGGTFLFLSYFGCDQSQVQRYLTGKSIAQSRLSLLFNAVAKIPMQFFILFIGAMVFVFYLFVQPPVLFQQAELAAHPGTLATTPPHAAAVQPRLRAAPRRRPWRWWTAHHARRSGGARAGRWRDYRAAQKQIDRRRAPTRPAWCERSGGEKGFSDTNYIFLSFVTRYLPAGIVGLVIAVIFAATMSASSGEINSLATVTVVDIYRRHVRAGRQRPSLSAGLALGHAFWGVYAVVFAGWGQEAGLADRGGEHGGLAVLRLAAGRASCWRSASARCAARRRSWACWRARRPSSGDGLLHATFRASGTT